MKKILSLILVFALLCSGMLILSSCGKDKNNGENNGGNEENNGNNNAEEKVTYTVTVLDQYDEFVKDAAVTIYVGPAKNELTTDENGVAKLTVAKSTLPVDAILESVPREFYDKGECDEVRFAADSTSVTFTVVKKDAYNVKVTNTLGEALSGVLVQICAGDTCSPFTKETDSNGEAVLYMSPDSEDVGIQINSVPDGYTKPVAKYYFEAGSSEIEIVLLPQ